MYSWHKTLMVSLGYFILLVLYQDELKTQALLLFLPSYLTRLALTSVNFSGSHFHVCGPPLLSGGSGEG